MKKLTQDEVEKAISLYLNGLSYQGIGAELGVSGQAIRGLLVRRGVAARTLSQAHRVIECNHNYFSELLDEARAYWLGFILADGSLTEKSYGRTKQISVGLGIVDIGHLEKLRGALQSSHKITIAKRDGVDCTAILRISSSELFDSLLGYGVEPRKSACHKFSERIPADLLPHYFRGYFDGNGGLSRHGTSKWTISNSASQEFLNIFVAWVGERIGGHSAPIYLGDGIHRVAWSGTHRCREILDLLYRDASVFLDRKKALYLDLCSEADASSRGAYNRK
jgi:hypothetical protein